MYLRTRSEGFGAEVKRRIVLGTYVLSAGYYDAYYRKAQQVRTLLRRDFEAAFRGCDVIATPTCPEVAFALGAKSGDPVRMYLSDVYTVSANLAGLPGVSLPCGSCERPADRRAAARARARRGDAAARGRRLSAAHAAPPRAAAGARVIAEQR